MNNSVLITGATGFLGTQVTRLILEQTKYPIIVLVRGRDLVTVKLRLKRIWYDWPNLIEEIGGRIRVLHGDLSLSQFGLSDSAYEELIADVRYIIHLAADIRLNEPLDVLRHTNVTGVRNLLDLAFAIHCSYGLTRLSYVSTAYVAGGRKGVVSEDALTDLYGFSNNYELSKYEAESLVRAAEKELPVSVFRPGMVVGDSKTGAIKTFNTIYFPLRLYLTGKLRILPVNPSLRINIVPCDYVSEAIVKLTFDPQAAGLTFHLTLPAESLPTVGEMVQFTRKWSAEKLHLKLPAPIFLPLPISRLKWLNRFLPKNSAASSILSLASYFEEKRVYQRDNLDRLLGAYTANWRDFFSQILTYAVDQGFMHNSERTVHEQVIFRLAGKSRPVRYHDVISGEIFSRSPQDISSEIRTIILALCQMGIKPGDRVAVVGYNSTRYFTIDAAIGLRGGVSVPLYYSSPLSELTEIIEACGARLFFVGVPEILEKLTIADLRIPVVSFCREMPQNKGSGNFMSWQDFIKLKADDEITVKAPIEFGDIATLRYTSGTTGRPKGAVFDHANLRWMAESLASLPSWKARTQRIVYLSFLPMNHVVEGILASYALYYAPAPIDIYYLESFQELQKVLPKVRPTVFFSVPRFYEKVWEKAAQSFIGRYYIKSRAGLRKQFLGIILRLIIKRTAGIDRCVQLIAGSAPVSPGLIQKYRSLGIEIYNAYGLTEAPLVTLNRNMANRIDTVGQSLPDTQIRVVEDGEVLVKGSQVMKGYFNDSNESPLKNGWLHTGDLGLLTDDDFLVLYGRKKEVMISSYGKNINPVKIELLLRECTGINQVLLCGDNKPYCTALLWGCPVHDQAAVDAIEQGIKKANDQLSHPEQIKKWALLAEDLTIEGGDLTANLKMKRETIFSKYSGIIETLYVKGTP